MLASKAICRPTGTYEAVVLGEACGESGQPQAGVSLVTMLVSTGASDASSAMVEGIGLAAEVTLFWSSLYEVAGSVQACLPITFAMSSSRLQPCEADTFTDHSFRVKVSEVQRTE